MFMKRRVSKILNFIAFNLLFFALYLNFVHKDSNETPVITTQQHQNVHATVIADNSAEKETKQNFEASDVSPATTVSDNTIALKLSFN